MIRKRGTISMLDDGLKVSFSGYLPLRDVVFNALREAILKGDLKPGERLMEKQLAEKMGVSRTPIREAIRKLELEGLVVMVPRKGAQVAEITEKDVRDVLEVRAALEELAVKLACAKISDHEVKQLKEAINEFEEARRKGDLETLVQLDIRFHDIIFKSTANDKLEQIINNLREQMFRYRLAYLRNESYHDKITDEHKDIAEALVEKDVERACRTAKQHIQNQEKAVINMMHEEQGQ
ncbi:GntR family transcriptional regulator [Vallitalea okinawensis]|uniref:GntR family transcriptional regulator n=1 Tax=Vallitalea okinawensis TaxID=2078660 RepID=UPI001FA838C6|nr:GntR family transcriptional regulator [Vallitalea okinawensis]